MRIFPYLLYRLCDIDIYKMCMEYNSIGDFEKIAMLIGLCRLSWAILAEVFVLPIARRLAVYTDNMTIYCQ